MEDSPVALVERSFLTWSLGLEPLRIDCVIRQPSVAKRDKLHALLQTVREHAPALLFFELNPLADFRDDEDTALEFVSRFLNGGKEETS